jgi:5-methylcytosine-specific restriction protein A
MPTAPPRLCRCGEVYVGKCSACSRRKSRTQDERRGTSTERGYDADWRNLRIYCFERDGWRCVDCGWRPELVEMYERIGAGVPDTLLVMEELRARQQAGGLHLQGDHIQTIADRPDLRLDVGNIATRCSRCHAKRTARENGWRPGTSTVLGEAR